MFELRKFYKHNNCLDLAIYPIQIDKDYMVVKFYNIHAKFFQPDFIYTERIKIPQSHNKYWKLLDISL